MTDDTLATKISESVGPIDFVVVEFPAGETNFSGEVIDELIALIDAGTIRLVDAVILMKDAEGAVDALELSDVADVGPLASIAEDLAEFLAEDDVAQLAAAMDPGSVAGALIYENVWAIPFADAARRAGGRLIADGRIHSQDIVDALEADAAQEQQGV